MRYIPGQTGTLAFLRQNDEWQVQIFPFIAGQEGREWLNGSMAHRASPTPVAREDS